MKNRFFHKIISVVLLIILCEFSNYGFTQELSVPEIKCCNDEQNVYETNCTYLQKNIDSQATDEVMQDNIISAAIQNSIFTTRNIAYFCFLPLSIITAPLALIAVWITMTYAIYTNDQLRVFRG